MGIYSDELTVLGLRILKSKTGNQDDYYVEYEFTGPNWKRNALLVVPSYMGLANIKFQTLHPFSSSHDINTGFKTESSTIWLNNLQFKVEDLT